MSINHYYESEDEGKPIVRHTLDNRRCWFKDRSQCNYCDGSVLPSIIRTVQHIEKHKIMNHPAIPIHKNYIKEWNAQLKKVGLWHKNQLWLWWSDPETDAGEGRVLCKSRQQMVWTVMHVAERLENLPFEIWLLILTFVKVETPAI